jgi:hypothetical protein
LFPEEGLWSQYKELNELPYPVEIPAPLKTSRIIKPKQFGRDQPAKGEEVGGREVAGAEGVEHW